MQFNSTWYKELLICPDCGSSLNFTVDSVHCQNCNFSNQNPKDLRPQTSSHINIDFCRQLNLEIENILKTIKLSPPEIEYHGPKARRDSQAFMSLMMAHLKPSSKVLDLGCGSKDQFAPISDLGHLYVGVDYSKVAADYLADAHSIPFQSSSFDCVFSYAVLEHLHNPFLAIKEINRVLKPGGIFIGSVSQGEPFHSSYFHLTAWGLISLVSSVPSLKIEQLWGSMDTLKSLSRMGRYPRLIRWIIGQIDRFHQAAPILSPRKMQWSSYELTVDKLYRAGSICFLIKKLHSDEE
jgi:SAM-dependent methyltransferase